MSVIRVPLISQYLRIARFNATTSTLDVIYCSLKAKQPKVFHFLLEEYRTLGCDLQSRGGVYQVFGHR